MKKNENSSFLLLIVSCSCRDDAMIHSLFLINTSGDVFLEKHWKSVISRSVVDYFTDAQNKAANNEDIPPVIATPHHYLISIFRSVASSFCLVSTGQLVCYY